MYARLLGLHTTAVPGPFSYPISHLAMRQSHADVKVPVSRFNTKGGVAPSQVPRGHDVTAAIDGHGSRLVPPAHVRIDCGHPAMSRLSQEH